MKISERDAAISQANWENRISKDYHNDRSEVYSDPGKIEPIHCPFARPARFHDLESVDNEVRVIMAAGEYSDPLMTIRINHPDLVYLIGSGPSHVLGGLAKEGMMLADLEAVCGMPKDVEHFLETLVKAFGNPNLAVFVGSDQIIFTGIKT